MFTHTHTHTHIHTHIYIYIYSESGEWIPLIPNLGITWRFVVTLTIHTSKTFLRPFGLRLLALTPLANTSYFTPSHFRFCFRWLVYFHPYKYFFFLAGILILIYAFVIYVQLFMNTSFDFNLPVLNVNSSGVCEHVRPNNQFHASLRLLDLTPIDSFLWIC